MRNVSHEHKPNYCHLEVFGVFSRFAWRKGLYYVAFSTVWKSDRKLWKESVFWWRRGDSGAAVRRAWCDVMCMDDRMITFHGRAVVCSDCSLQRRASKSDCGRRKCCPRAGPDELSREKAATWTARAASLCRSAERRRVRSVVTDTLVNTGHWSVSQLDTATSHVTPVTWCPGRNWSRSATKSHCKRSAQRRNTMKSCPARFCSNQPRTVYTVSQKNKTPNSCP